MQVTRSLLRGLGVLEALAAQAEPTGPARLAEVTGLDKATVSRLLSTFVVAGYVTHDTRTGRYWMTGRVLRLARGFLEHSDLRSLARPHLTALRDEVGESVHLGQLDGLQVVYVDKLEGSSPVRLVSAIGQTMPLHTTALGKAMLAALDEPSRASVVPQLTLAPRTAHSIVEPDALLAELRATAERGYATDRQENEENVTCVGAAVRDDGGSVLGAISISGPRFRMAPRLEELGERCRAAAEEISRDLPAGEIAPLVIATNGGQPAATVRTEG